MSDLKSYTIDDIYVENNDIAEIKKLLKQIDDVLRSTYGSKLIRTEDICNGTNSNIIQMYDILNKEFSDIRRSIEELRLTINMRMHTLEKVLQKKQPKPTRKCFSFRRCLGCMPQ